MVTSKELQDMRIRMQPLPPAYVPSEEDKEETQRKVVPLAILMKVLALKGVHMYDGSVSPAKRAKRRKANKVARRSRRKNR